MQQLFSILYRYRFAKLFQIIEELQQLAKEKTWAGNMLQSDKQYFKTSYRCDCQHDESECSDHSQKFALSDSKDPHFQEKCLKMCSILRGQALRLKDDSRYNDIKKLPENNEIRMGIYGFASFSDKPS